MVQSSSFEVKVSLLEHYSTFQYHLLELIVDTATIVLVFVKEPSIFGYKKANQSILTISSLNSNYKYVGRYGGQQWTSKVKTQFKSRS